MHSTYLLVALFVKNAEVYVDASPTQKIEVMKTFMEYVSNTLSKENPLALGYEYNTDAELKERFMCAVSLIDGMLHLNVMRV